MQDSVENLLGTHSFPFFTFPLPPFIQGIPSAFELTRTPLQVLTTCTFTTTTVTMLITHVERTGYCKILYPHYPRTFDHPSRPHPSTSRGNTLSNSRGGHGVGARRPSGRHRELPQQAECGGRDERLEFGHAEASRPRGEDVDGGECGTGSAG